MTQSVLVLSYNGQTEVFVNMYGPKQVSLSEPGNEFDCANTVIFVGTMIKA